MRNKLRVFTARQEFLVIEEDQSISVGGCPNLKVGQSQQ